MRILCDVAYLKQYVHDVNGLSVLIRIFGKDSETVYHYDSVGSGYSYEVYNKGIDDRESG